MSLELSKKRHSAPSPQCQQGLLKEVSESQMPSDPTCQWLAVLNLLSKTWTLAKSLQKADSVPPLDQTWALPLAPTCKAPSASCRSSLPPCKQKLSLRPSSKNNWRMRMTVTLQSLIVMECQQQLSRKSQSCTLKVTVMMTIWILTLAMRRHRECSEQVMFIE